MTIATYPAGTESGFTDATALNSERERLINNLGGRMASFVSKPFAQGDYDTTGASGLDVDVAAGEAFVEGHLVISDATETITLADNATNQVYITVDDALTDEAAIEAKTGGTTPSRKHYMQIAEVTTSSGSVDSITDNRPYVPYRESSVSNSITGRKSGTSGDIAIDSTGVKSVSVSFSNDYRTNIDDAQATLNKITDTSVEFGFVRVTSLATSGFTVEAKVTTAAGSGATANVNWAAMGD